MDKTIKSLEALDKTLANLIDGAPEKGAKLVDWLYNQVPEVVTQLLTWHMVESGVQALMSLMWVIGSIVFAAIATRKFHAWAKAEKCTADPEFIIPAIFGNLVFLIISACNVGHFMDNLTWLKIWIAPKVYLLEYLSSHAIG